MANTKQGKEVFSGGDIVEVLLPKPFDHGFDYAVPEGVTLKSGDYVSVPFGRTTETGVVWKASDGNVPAEKIKPVAEHLTHLPAMGPLMREFIRWVAWYTLSPKGMVMKMAVPIEAALKLPKERKSKAKPKKSEEVIEVFSSPCGLAESGLIGKAITYTPPSFSSEQAAAAQALPKTGFHVTLLDGVTGSGKTEVYFDTIASILNAPAARHSVAHMAHGSGLARSADLAPSPQALILLPEIALTVQWLERFEKRFGFTPTLWHSDVSLSAKKKAWREIANGQARLVVGARSALFLPYPNLKLIVVDEEHESSYKQEEGVIYHARDMAVARAHIEQIPVILVSATPSLETAYNVQQGKFSAVHLPARHGSASFPEVKVVDMRESAPPRGGWLSPPLREALTETLLAGNQAMLFLNRRGYAPLMLCRACGHRFQCPSCSSWLVMHRTKPRLECHHCGYFTPPPKHCPACKAEDALVPCGPGVERVHEEVKELYPRARIALMTSDLVETAKQAEALVTDIAARKIDIIIGTQMMAKGHHFPGLALVGIVDADLGLQGGDLRAGERTYQLLHQMAGRAGRELIAGRVLLQSYLPDHPVMDALIHGRRDEFMQNEARMREEASLPPYGRLAALIIEGSSQEEAQRAAQKLAKTAEPPPNLRLFGPVPAPLFMLRGKYRYRLLVKTPRGFGLQPYMAEWLKRAKIPNSIKLKIDVDPYSFL